jgi:hypothetical protein
LIGTASLMGDPAFFACLYQLHVDAGHGDEQGAAACFAAAVRDRTALARCVARLNNPDPDDPGDLPVAILYFLIFFFKSQAYTPTTNQRLLEAHQKVLHDLLCQAPPIEHWDSLLLTYFRLSQLLGFSTSDFFLFRREIFGYLANPGDPLQFEFGLRCFERLITSEPQTDRRFTVPDFLTAIQSFTPQVFLTTPDCCSGAGHLFCVLTPLLKIPGTAKWLMRSTTIIPLVLEVCASVERVQSRGLVLSDTESITMMERTVNFCLVLVRRFRAEFRGDHEILAGVYGQVLPRFLDLILLSPAAFARDADGGVFRGCLLSTIEVLHSMTQSMPDEALEKLLACILLVVPLGSDTDRFPGPKRADALFGTTASAPACARTHARRLFEAVFYTPARLEFALVVFCSPAVPYSEGLLFLLHTIPEHFPEHRPTLDAGARLLSLCLPVVRDLAIWTVDSLSYLRTASRFFGSLSADQQQFVQRLSGRLMRECNPGATGWNAVGFTIGIEALSHILMAGGAATPEQTEVLARWRGHATGDIGERTFSMVTAGSPANRIVAVGVGGLLELLRRLCGQTRRNSLPPCAPEPENEVLRRCEHLARHMPGVTALQLGAIRELVRLSASFTLTFADGGLAKVFAAVAAIPATPDFGQHLIKLFAGFRIGIWGPALAPIVLRFICAHQMLPHAAAAVADHLFQSDWSGVDRSALSGIADLMCAYVHLGITDDRFIQNVLAHLSGVDAAEPGIANALIRWAATLFLAFGTPLLDGWGEVWVNQVQAGWFSTPYLSQLTILSFSRLAGGGDGNAALTQCIEGLWTGGFPRLSADEVEVWGQPEGMETLLVRYGTQ